MMRLIFGVLTVHLLLIVAAYTLHLPKRSTPPPLARTQVRTLIVQEEERRPKPQQQPKKKSVSQPKKKPASRKKLLAAMEKTLEGFDTDTPQKSIPHPKQVGPLASEAISFSTPYEEQLIAYLKGLLEFPEHGSVKIKLTLCRNGAIQTFSIVNATSERNRHYLEAILPTISLPPFETHFKNEPSHTFSMMLTSEN